MDTDITIQAEIGFGLDQSVTASARVQQADIGSISRVIFRAFLPSTMDRSNDSFQVESTPVAVHLERRYELPDGAPLRVEVQTTSGFAGHPVTVSASVNNGPVQTVSGMSNEDLAVELPQGV